MLKTWIVYCDICGKEIHLQYPPQDMVYYCEHCNQLFYGANNDGLL